MAIKNTKNSHSDNLLFYSKIYKKLILNKLSTCLFHE